MNPISQEQILALIQKFWRVKKMLKLNSNLMLIAYWASLLMQSSVEDTTILALSKELNQYHFSLLTLIG